MHIPAAKTLLRKSYKVAMGLHAVASVPFSSWSTQPRIFYGGARAGDAGGAPVKVKRLNEYFPEHRWSYNLIYCLSNTPYLPEPALRLLKGRGVPIITNQSGAFYAGWYAGDWQARNTEISHAYHLADHVFWQSEFSRQSVKKFLGERDGNGEVLYNAVDTKTFQPRPLTRGPAESGFRFLVSGKTDPHLAYRVEAAIKGLAHARQQGLEASLKIAGVMTMETSKIIGELVNNCGLSDCVTFTGSYTQTQAPTLYASCDAYVLLTHNDVCPNSALEAMACGLPVIHASTGGTPELVGKAGAMIETSESWERPSIPDARDVAQAMITVASNHSVLASLARLRAIEKFDIAHWIRRHTEIIGNLLRRRS